MTDHPQSGILEESNWSTASHGEFDHLNEADHNDVYRLPSHPEEAVERGARPEIARFGPGDELGEIDTAVSGFAIVDVAVGLAQPAAQVALGETGLLPQRA